MNRIKNKMWLFLLPSLCGMLIFYFLPFILSLYYALIANMANKQFVGLQNSINTFSNPMFQLGIRNTIRFMAICIPINLLLAVLLACALKRTKRGYEFAAFILLLPLIIPAGTIAYFWKHLFDTIGFPLISLANSEWIPAITLILFLWKSLGFSVILLWIGLMQVPKEYYEIAMSEKANTFQRFLYITVPYISPAIFIAILFSIINSFKIFKEIYILYGNYPSPQLYMLQHYMNNQFFSLNLQKLASASYVLSFTISIIIFVLFKAQKSITDSFGDIPITSNEISVKGNFLTWFSHVIIIFVVALILTPVLFIIINSFDFNAKRHILSHYIDLMLNNPVYIRKLYNSIAIVTPVLIGQCIVSPLGAYAFERMNYKYKEILFFAYIIVMLMPMQVLLVPNYVVANLLGFTDSWLAIILPGMFNPLGVFLIRQHLKGLPRQCVEAAQIDGASEWNIFRKIVVPNVIPSMITVFVLTFAEYWNVVDQAVVFIKSPDNEPLSVYLSRIITCESGVFFAASTIYLAPALIIFFLGKRWLLSNFSLYRK